MQTPLIPAHLRCEWLIAPLGIDESAPRLQWQLHVPSNVPGFMQQAYQLQVASSLNNLLVDSADIWDTEKTLSAQQNIVYAGLPLRSGSRYFWRVRVWDQDDRPSAWSPSSWWEMGLLSQQDWFAQWIHFPLLNPTNDVLEPCRYFRRMFHTHSPIQQARLYVTARGVYEATINGQRIGDAYLAPGWTDYDQRIQYQTYDVTTHLLYGENVLGVILGSGWYCGHVASIGPRNYGASPQLLAQLEVTYSDGTRECIPSDPHWRASLGPLLFADLLKGETYDARYEKPGWDVPGFDDTAWQAVAVLPRFTSPRLVAELAQPVRITEILAPRQITRRDAETQLVNFGQNLVGWVRIRIPAHATDAIRLCHAEMLDEQGQLYTANLRSADQVDLYTPANSEQPVFYSPRFTFHGFCYVEVTGYPGDLCLEDIQACVLGSDTPRIGSFHCGHPLVNQLYQNIVWGQRGNFLSVPTDCPQRDERMGWLGDAQIFARTAAYNMDVAAIFTKWLHDVLDGQSSNGAFPDIAPRIVVLNDGAPAWGDAGVIVPWTLYRMYGDTRILETMWEPMEQWMRYLTLANPSGLRQARNGNNYGDWLAVDDQTEDHTIATRTPKELLATAYYAQIARLMHEMALVLDKLQEAEYYASLFQHIKQAFNTAYVRPDGSVYGETQTAYVLALAFDLIPAELRHQCASHLVANIAARDWHLATGFLGIGYLLPILTDLGYPEVAYRLLLQETYPSWGYSIRQGATTIWERWDGWTEERGFQDPMMNSFNHYSLGSVGEWLYRYVAGIEPLPTRDGAGLFRIRPYPATELGGWAQATWQSPYGVVSSGWRLEHDELTLIVQIPPNTRATVILPTSSPEEARYHVAHQLSRSLQAIEIQDDTVRCTISAGQYTFVVPYSDNVSQDSTHRQG